jgi:hypothetical protein
MKYALMFIAAAVYALPGCTSMRVDGAWVYGPGVRSVTLNDIHAAIAAVKADPAVKSPIYKIYVVSANEMHFYHDRRDDVGYNIAERRGPKWIFERQAIVMESIPLGD